MGSNIRGVGSNMRGNTDMTDMNYARGFIQRKETFGFASADCKRSECVMFMSFEDTNQA